MLPPAIVASLAFVVPHAPALQQQRILATPQILRTPVPQAALPSASTLGAACVLPTCLGFWKNGYAVSYSYGGAMVACGALTLPHTTGLAAAHAAAFIFYGARLILFLLYREICLPVSVHQMAQREATLKERLKRAPVILGCAFLYFCMAAPLRVTALSAPTLGPLAAAAIAMMWIGISLAAVGDTWKSIVKARKGADALVTGGPFAIFRHPNYTGEVCAREPTTHCTTCRLCDSTSRLSRALRAPVLLRTQTIAWAASYAAACLAAVSVGAVRSVGWFALSALGTVGIGLVLAEATSGLEKKQRAKRAGPTVYKPRKGRSPAQWVSEESAESAEYDAWVAKTWAGVTL